MSQQKFTVEEIQRKHSYRVIDIDGLNATMRRIDGYERIITLCPFEESGICYVSKKIQDDPTFENFFRLCTSLGDWRYGIKQLLEIRFQHERINDPVTATRKYLEAYSNSDFVQFDDYIQEMSA
jgi:hypothetical protein